MNMQIPVDSCAPMNRLVVADENKWCLLLPSFSRISARGNARMILNPGADDYKVVVYAVQGSQKENTVTIGVDKFGTLEISQDVNGKTKGKRSFLVIEVYAKKLDGIQGKGYLEVETRSALESDRFLLEVEGCLRGRLEIHANTLVSKISGTGKLEISGTAADYLLVLKGTVELGAFSLDARNIDACIDGPCKANLCASQQAIVSAAGFSRVSIAGRPQDFRKHAEWASIKTI